MVLAVGVTVMLTAAVQGAVGFGMNLLAVPVLLVLAPQLVPGPLLVGTTALVAASALRERAHLDRGVWWALLGRLPGTALGALLLLTLTHGQLAVPIAVMVLAGCALTALPLPVPARPTRGPLLVAGAVSGFMGTVSTIGGPPMALVYSRAGGPRLRSSLAAYFLAGTVLTLVVFVATGVLDAHGSLVGLALVPPALLGSLLARPLAARLDAGRTRQGVVALSAVAGLLALAGTLL